MKDEEDCEIIELNHLIWMTCIKIAFSDDDASKAVLGLRDLLYHNLQEHLHGEKLPCDIRTTEGVLIREGQNITRRLLLRLIREKDSLLKTESVALNYWLFGILDRFKLLDFSDVPFWTRKSKQEAKA